MKSFVDDWPEEEQLRLLDQRLLEIRDEQDKALERAKYSYRMSAQEKQQEKGYYEKQSEDIEYRRKLLLDRINSKPKYISPTQSDYYLSPVFKKDRIVFILLGVIAILLIYLLFHRLPVGFNVGPIQY